MTYRQLTQDERYMIVQLRRERCGLSEMARLMGRARSTIWRELKRNMIPTRHGLGYCVSKAQEQRNGRLRRSRRGSNYSAEDYALVRRLLLEQWSPEQIAGLYPVSHEALYLQIYADKLAGGLLWRQLRSQKKHRKRYAGGRDRRGQIAGRRPIGERPAYIEQRRKIGHWEGDTVIGAGHKQAIVSLVERKSGYAILAKVANKTADLVSAAIINGLTPVLASVETITFDNGKEFAGHAGIDAALGSTTYFADPYSSWQRGSNENLNGLIRQYVPKKRPFSTVTDQEIKMIQDRLNHRPRKRLGFKTPHEVFHALHKPVALRD